MHNIPLRLNYSMASTFCVVVVMKMLPMHISACYTAGYTMETIYSAAGHTEYRYKVFARVIIPCNLSLVFILIAFLVNTYALLKFVTSATCKSLHWYMHACIFCPLAWLTLSILFI